MQMRFEWDEEKNRRNRTKHGLSFESVVDLFFDPRSIPKDDREVNGEERKWLIGWTRSLIVTVVVYVTKDEYDEEIIRIISARRATRSERLDFEASLRRRDQE